MKFFYHLHVQYVKEYVHTCTCTCTCTLYVRMYIHVYGWLDPNFTSHVHVHVYTVYTCVCVTVCLVPCATEHLRCSIQSVLSGGPAAQTACRTPQPTVSSTSASTLTATARLSLSLTLSSLFSPTRVWERRSGYLNMLSVSLVPRPICGFFPLPQIILSVAPGSPP